MATTQVIFPSLPLPGHFHHLEKTALTNVMSVQCATLPWLPNLHLITSVAGCSLLQDHLVAATPQLTQSPSFSTVWMTCVCPMGVKTCFAVVWGSTLLHARIQGLKSNHGGMRSAVSIINLDFYAYTCVVSLVFSVVPVHVNHTGLHTCFCCTLASSVQWRCQIDVRLVGRCTVYEPFFPPSHSALMPWKLSLQYMRQCMSWVLWYFIRCPLPMGLLWRMSMWLWIYAEWKWLRQSWEMWLLLPGALLWGESLHII